MGKDKSLFQKGEKSITAKITIFVILMVLLAGGYYTLRNKLNQRFSVVDKDYSWIYQVDSVEEKGKLVLTGFAFELGRNAEADFDILLVNIQKTGSSITGPKMLRCFGASYLYPVFIRLGVICDGEDKT